MAPPPLDPRDKIVIIELAHGCRIDVTAVHPASGECRTLPPVHQPNLTIARAVAARLHAIMGFPVEERLRGDRA